MAYSGIPKFISVNQDSAIIEQYDSSSTDEGVKFVHGSFASLVVGTSFNFTYDTITQASQKDGNWITII